MPYELLLKPENQAFLAREAQSSAPALILRYAQDAEKRFLAEQIAARQRIRKKLPHFYQNLALALPPSHNLEQSSSEETAALKASLVPAGQEFADLTGGLGIDALALHERFTRAYYREKDPELCALFGHNSQQVGKSFDIACASAEKSLADLPPLDLIYLDPSRRNVGEKQAFALSDYQPNVLEMQEALLQKSSAVLIKSSPMIDVHRAQGALLGLCEIWFIARRNELKEVLFLLQRESPSAGPRLRCWNLLAGKSEPQYFEALGGQKPSLSSIAAQSSGYLYEANAALMKAGLQDQAAARFGLAKLEPNSHLYYHSQSLPSFPGRIWQILGFYKAYDPFFKKGRFNVISRNFPDSAPQIEQRLRLKPGQDFLIASQWQGKSCFIAAQLLAH